MDRITFVNRILTDPAFRRMLETDPRSVLPQATADDLRAIRKVLELASQAGVTVDMMADHLLCTSLPQR